MADIWRAIGGASGEWGGSFLLDKVCHDFDIFGRLMGARAAKVASFGGRRIFDEAARGTRIAMTTARPPMICATQAGRAPTTRSIPAWT